MGTGRRGDWGRECRGGEWRVRRAARGIGCRGRPEVQGVGVTGEEGDARGVRGLRVRGKESGRI